MKRKDAKLISRSLDGALSPEERIRVERLLETDSGAAATARVWQDIGDQLRIDAGRAPVPDPLLAWQEIRRKVRTTATQPDTPVMGSLFGIRLRWVAGLASVVFISLIGWSLFHDPRVAGEPVVSAPSPAAASERVEWVVAEIPGATTMIYTDRETDMTVIWMDLAQTDDPRDS